MSPQRSTETAEEHIRLDHLRDAIRGNKVSFPAPTPVFECQHRADIQWRLVELYFIRGWSCTQLGRRYQVTATRIQQLLRGWVKRATALGYLQEIPSEDRHAAQIVRAWDEAPVVDVSMGPILTPAVFTGAGVEKRPE